MAAGIVFTMAPTVIEERTSAEVLGDKGEVEVEHIDDDVMVDDDVVPAMDVGLDDRGDSVCYLAGGSNITPAPIVVPDAEVCLDDRERNSCPQDSYDLSC
uniref:Uncharacterized protein n=1 Tax=Nelumbo nucifera TaxID=4432 RepID=A0A822Z6H8_NELNU|nr:TPA_asm: hypothetical protein HUJ06_013398 [Nelumbo nucifera]